MIENGSVVVTHARAASLSTAVDSVAKCRMRNVRDYYPPKDYHRVATATTGSFADGRGSRTKWVGEKYRKKTCNQGISLGLVEG